MKPPIFQRAAAVLLAGAFVLAGSADVYGLHACPHHEQPHAPPSSPVGPSHAGTQPERDDAEDPHRDHDDGPCTCVGSCHVSASVPLVPTGPAVAVAPATALAGAAGGHDVLPGAPSPYLTPYPTGPPSAT